MISLVIHAKLRQRLWLCGRGQQGGGFEGRPSRPKLVENPVASDMTVRFRRSRLRRGPGWTGCTCMICTAHGADWGLPRCLSG